MLHFYYILKQINVNNIMEFLRDCQTYKKKYRNEIKSDLNDNYTFILDNNLNKYCM